MPNTKEPEENSKNIVSLTTSPEFMFLLQRIDRVEEKLSARINQVEEKLSARMEQEIGNLRQDVNSLKQDNHALRGLIWGTFSLILAAIGIAATVAITILR